MAQSRCRIWIFGLGLSASTLGCAEDAGGDDPCSYQLCSISKPGCVDRIAEAVACHMEIDDPILPNVRRLTRDEVRVEAAGEREMITDAELRDYDDYYRGEALAGLVPEGYGYQAADDAWVDWAAGYYESDRDQITLIEENLGTDRRRDYLLLVHEMVHAFQDAQRDLDAVYDAHAQTFDRFLGLRAVTEGEAEMYEVRADVQMEGFAIDRILWSQWFDDYQGWALDEAQLSETPSTDVLRYYPYAFGVELAHDERTQGGAPALEDLFYDPPDSARFVVAHAMGAASVSANSDASLDQYALPVFPERYTPLGGRHAGAWLLNATLQRTARSSKTWSPLVDDTTADYFSVYRDEQSGEVAIIWRIMTSDATGLVAQLRTSGSDWSGSRSTHDAFVQDGDVVLVATSGDDVASVISEIGAWGPLVEPMASSRAATRLTDLPTCAR